MPGREVGCCKSARICKGKIILIRHNYFPSNINSGSCCINTDIRNDHIKVKSSSIPKHGHGPTLLHRGPRSNTKMIQVPSVRQPAEITGSYQFRFFFNQFRFRKMKTVVSAVFKSSIYRVFIFQLQHPNKEILQNILFLSLP